MKKRIYGIETEYGLLIKNDKDFSFDPMEIANRVKDHIFLKKNLAKQHTFWSHWRTGTFDWVVWGRLVCSRQLYCNDN